jgi:hypothetical protein
VQLWLVRRRQLVFSQQGHHVAQSHDAWDRALAVERETGSTDNLMSVADNRI